MIHRITAPACGGYKNIKVFANARLAGKIGEAFGAQGIIPLNAVSRGRIQEAIRVHIIIGHFGIPILSLLTTNP
jgi:hypothetical protein